MWTAEKVEAEIKRLGAELIWVTSEVSHLHKLLLPDEIMIYIISGDLKKIHNEQMDHSGVVVLTDSRIIFFRRNILGETTTETTPLHTISSVSTKSGLLFASLHIYTANNESVVEDTLKKQLIKMAGFIQAQLKIIAEQQVGEPGKQAPVAARDYSLLEKLFELKTNGILTEEEFQAEKARFLA